jgi:hypothetical protein
MSDGAMEALTRAGAKENGPTASSAASATASAPARLRAVRRFMGAGGSIDDFLLARRLDATNRDRGTGGTILGDGDIPVNQGSPEGRSAACCCF